MATAVSTDVSTPRAVEDVTIASGAASAALPLVLRMGRSDGLPLHIPHRIGTAFAQRLPGAAAMRWAAREHDQIGSGAAEVYDPLTRE
jgi:hypothetical protein